jgi:hypothetical protein
MRGWDWEQFKDVKFAITEVRLTDKAEAKRSKNYMPALEGYDAATVPGSDSFRFAPAKDAVRIRYKIFDPGKRIKSGTLTLKRVRDGQVLWSRPLQPNEWKEGDVSILWKGRVAGARAFFAKDYLTLEHSPYRLEVNVDGEGFGEPPLGWTQFEVRAKIQLEFGPRTVLAASAAQGTSAAQLGVVSGLERDHQVWEYLNGNELPPPYAYLPAPTVDNLAGRVPAEAETKRVYLVSNVFSSGVSQQISNAQFGEQRTAWAGAGGAGDFGPNIPVFVKVEVMDLSDAPVASPAAIGGAKVLWEWEDATAASDELGYIQETEDYLMSAENYDIATTTPPGRGCHADRGGKRGLPGCVVFPAQADPGTMNPGPRVFPFEVSHAVATNRTWAAASTINTAGPHSCKTGVIFQPSHIAGDAYKLRGYLYYPSELPLVNVADVDGPNHPKETIPKERQVTSGRFEIWHELHIPAYYKKKAGLIGGVGVSADIDLARVVDLFAPAFLRVRYLQVWDAVGLRFVAFQAMVQATYDNALNQLVVNALALVPPPNSLPWFIASAIDQPNNNWAQGNYVFHYKTHAQYRLALEARGMPVTALAPPIDLDPIDPNTQAWDDRYYADDNYYKRMANLHYSRRMLIHLVEAYIGANPRDGVYLFQADGFSQFGDAYCNAASACFLPHNPHRAPFFSVKGNFSCTIEETCAHEIGHVLFLNHIEPGDQNPWKFHASAGGSCLMSYNFMPPRSLCASCLLRLRGWSLYRVNPNGTTHEPALLARNPDTGRTLGLNPADNPVTSPNTITVTKYI